MHFRVGQPQMWNFIAEEARRTVVTNQAVLSNSIFSNLTLLSMCIFLYNKRADWDNATIKDARVQCYCVIDSYCDNNGRVKPMVSKQMFSVNCRLV